MFDFSKLHYIGFANKSWDKGCKKRIWNSLNKIHESFPTFSDYELFDESDLGSDYLNVFSKYFGDNGFAYWSWKPYIIQRKLNKIPDNDYLMYIDCGCVFPDDVIEEFCKDLCDLIYKIKTIGLTICYGIPCYKIITKKILEFFELQNDNFFKYKYPHYQSGLIILRKNLKTVKLINDWYSFYLQHYENVRTQFKDKTDQEKGFIHNGMDQAVLQCLLYKSDLNILNMTSVFRTKYGFIKRQRM